MSKTQQAALSLMRDRNLGAVVTRLGWTWPEHVRNSEAAALEVIEVLCA